MKNKCTYILLFARLLALGIICQITLSGCSSSKLTSSVQQSKSLPDRESVWRSSMRKALMIPDQLPALDVKVHGQFEAAPDVMAERVSYGTQFGMRIPAIVYFPKEHKGKMPAMIVVNGHGGDKYSWYSIWSGIMYARAGAVVLTFDPTGEGERNKDHKSGTRAHDHLDPINASWHTALARRQGGLIIGDVMQAVSYLSTRPDVDSTRIGAMGYSMGSFIVALTGAVEPRLHACVIAGGGGFEIPKGEWKGLSGSKPSCIQGLPYQSLRFFKDPPAIIYSLNASRGPALVVNGELDWDGTPRKHPNEMKETRQRTIEFRGSSNGIFDVSALEPGAIHRPYFVNRDVFLWLHHQMQFPNITEAQILAMPTTYIRDWAEKEHVQMDPDYMTEGLEAGMHALGTNVPGLTREQLSVFSPEEWKKQKDNLILNSWVAHTLKDMGVDSSTTPAKKTSKASVSK
jgi:dienelactone hydrolase